MALPRICKVFLEDTVISSVIVWFRRDLRVEDHAALWAAQDTRKPIVPVFIWSPEEEKPWEPGGAVQWWLHFALKKFEEELKKVFSRDSAQPLLQIRRGPTAEALLELAREFGSHEVFFHQGLDPMGEALDKKVHALLSENQISTRRFLTNRLFKPDAALKEDRTPYRVFTPYYRNALKIQIPAILPAPTNLTLARKAILRTLDNPPLTVEDLGLLQGKFWAKKFYHFWNIASPEHPENPPLDHILPVAEAYTMLRDYPGSSGTSKLSPYLHFGQLSPRQIYWALKKNSHSESVHQFLRQLYWREFAHDQIAYFPDMDLSPLRKEFLKFPYEENETHFKAWTLGQTGYPIVDAAMRELWNTGFMHNRCRMITGSFLVKDLLCPWTWGAKWFWDTLVDADLANNSMGWQWIGGTGIDAAPYFRIFNPVLQSQKFDPEGKYIRTFIPELRLLSAKDIHAPWLASPKALAQANVTLGIDYPFPIVDHKAAQAKALHAYSSLK